VADLWYYQQQGEARGPLPLAHLRALAVAGEIDPSTLVWQQELTDWVELSSLDVRTSGGQLPPPVPPPLPQTSPQPVHKPTASKPRAAAAGSRTPLIAAGLVVAILAAAALGFVGRGILDTPGAGVASVKSQNSPTEPLTRKLQTPVAPATSSAETPPAPKPAPANLEPDPAADIVPMPKSPAVVPATTTPPEDTTTAPTEKTTTTAAPAENIASANPPPETPPAKPAATSSQPVVLFQELDIQRMPKLGMLGTMTVQDLRYQIQSQLTVAPPDQEGNIGCDQVVLQTKLVKSDDLSRAMFQDSLTKLQGWQFSYQVNNRRVITQWKAAPPDGRKVAEVKPVGGTGFLATSVMDDDGWKELAQLTFFVPRPERGSKSWKQPMMHNFGPLGMWYGETTFTPQATRKDVQQIAFVHKMEYRPPEKGAGGELPFTIEKAMLKPETAGGTIEFDTQANRVASAQEGFLVRGALSVGLLGQAADVEVEEQQVISLRIHDRNPWTK